ncbi:uncharacterized protein LOC131030231 [Cryptomeria japonica]|uniref:uncharacterized protein LOC131030231 n=1 Tax=Cryptomeria japonica TaxID=3369 RepID=UPI0025AB9CF0|nr:uncharacterized protein LOC131030231 [Cryptomeria japonica]
MVENSETVATLKQKICELEKIPTDWQELTLEPKVSDTLSTKEDESVLKSLSTEETNLEDTKTMSYYNIEELQIISLDIRMHTLNEETAMKVYIRRPNRPHNRVDHLAFYVESWWTIRFVKVLLRYFCVMDKKIVLDESQTLEFEKEKLNNNMNTIADYNIRFVNTYLGYLCQLDKNKVLDEFQRLEFQEEVLDDEMTIADCNIRNEDQLEIVTVKNVDERLFWFMRFFFLVKGFSAAPYLRFKI